MAFASVISLKHTIKHLRNSSDIFLVPPSRKIIKSAYKKLNSLQKTLERLDGTSKRCNRKRVNVVDGQIREAVLKLEDVIECHVSNQLLSQSESRGDEVSSLMLTANMEESDMLERAPRDMLNRNQTDLQSVSYGGETDRALFSIDLQGLKKEIHSIIETLTKMEKEYMKELDNLSPEEDDDAVSSRIDFGRNKSKVVGLSSLSSIIRDELITRGDQGWGLSAVSIFGMAGIGKTTLAENLFEDPIISSQFDCRLWVTVGRKYQLNKIKQGILAQLNLDANKAIMEGNDNIAKCLEQSLKGKRYLIVLDDLWERQVWEDICKFLPRNKNGSRVLLTTRLGVLGLQGVTFRMPLLNKEESWDLLRENVFGEELCPPQLEIAGKKIAEKCEGLPLTIVTVANLLSKSEKTPEYWNEVAEKKELVFMDAYDEISKVLFPSYEYLPQYLKACFLYVGVLPQSYEFHRSRLISLWIVEGILDTTMQPTSEEIDTYMQPNSEEIGMSSLGELISNSVVIVYKESALHGLETRGVKTCGLHSSFWHLCKVEAEKNRFFRILNSRKDGLEEAIKGQRRLCIHNNILFGIKDVYNSIEGGCVSTARSLLCLGPYHQYQVPVCFGLTLLKVLDILTIRFYEFPIEAVKLVQLNHLALTYNGNIPASISKLRKLQYLIVLRHLSIKSCKASSYLPLEIWDMKELKHLQIMGSDLPDPCGALLPNLLALQGVSARSCTKRILEGLPNLKKLGIQIELESDGAETLCCFDHRLRSLKCVIVNPELRSNFVALPNLSTFPSYLTKLTLSGLGYPWEEMRRIDSLLRLKMLKLQCYAFQGPKWEIEENRFISLEFLLIEDTDLVHWKIGLGSFRWLRSLNIKHCYKLVELQWKPEWQLLNVEIVDCNPGTVTWATEFKEAKLKNGWSYHGVYVHSSCNDESLKS